ncbi:MAG: hypothetical protein QM687_04475 [Ferruginibacter sp.]
MKNDFFDKQVREKLSAHEAPVPPDAWENIQKGKRKRRPFAFFWLPAICILAAVSAVYIYHSKKNAASTVLADQTVHPAETTVASATGETSKHNEPAKGSMAVITTPGTTVVSIDNNNMTSDNHSPQNAPGQGTATPGNMIASFHTANHSSHKKNKDQGDSEAIFSKNSHINSSKGKTAIRIKAAETTEDNNEAIANDEQPAENIAINSKDTPAIVTVISAASAGKSSDSSAMVPVKDSIAKSIAINEPTEAAKKEQKKKTSRITIGLAGAGFLPFGNSSQLTSLSRTTATPMRTTEFTADKINIRLQPGVSFTAFLQKAISPKWSLEAGISYTSLKEYIHLSGEEINTYYNIVKRLESNSLVNDTVASISRGTRIIDAVNSYRFLSIPLAAQYNIWQRKSWTLQANAGIDINLVTKYRNSITGNIISGFGSGTQPSRNSSIGTGFHFQLRAGRQLYKHLDVYLAPYLQVNPRKLYSPGMLQPRSINRAGIGFGITYHF